MKDDNAADSGRLLTLERWRAAELEAAQAEHVKLERIRLEKQSIVDGVESEIDAMQSFVREQVSDGQAISAEALQRFTRFAALQAQELSTAQQALETSRNDSEAAHTNVVEHFERLSVVERLRERRQAEAAKDAVRVAQKQLDEHALSRMPAEAGMAITRGEE